MDIPDNLTNQNLLTIQVSVVVPVYNVENYLDACLTTLTQQTFSDFEIILVDDGSTDRSGKKCDIWKKKDRRISVIHQENGGLSAARNCGVRASKGEYIVFVDSDDTVEPDCVEQLVRSMEINKADLAVGMMERSDRKKSKNTRKLPVFMGKDEAIELLLQGKLPVSANAKLYKKDMIQNLQFVEGMVYEDNLYAYQILSACGNISVVNKVIYHHIIHEGSITETYSIKNLIDMRASMNMVKAFLQNRCPDDIDAVLYKEIVDWLKIEYFLEHVQASETQTEKVIRNFQMEQRQKRKMIIGRGKEVFRSRKRFGNGVLVRYLSMAFFPGICGRIKGYKECLSTKRR